MVNLKAESQPDVPAPGPVPAFEPAAPQSVPIPNFCDDLPTYFPLHSSLRINTDSSHFSFLKQTDERLLGIRKVPAWGSTITTLSARPRKRISAIRWCRSWTQSPTRQRRFQTKADPTYQYLSNVGFVLENPEDPLPDDTTDDELAVSGGKISLKDPLSLDFFTEPVMSKTCKHVFEDKYIRQQLQGHAYIHCPITGCEAEGAVT
ncbi:hypothetical protein JCM33374_g6181 [Metschnikowia sp. JCM 33374]|nr:hypothetical protein JCM33374_g6181 [Metschnikowia sp. JCM 33374]